MYKYQTLVSSIRHLRIKPPDADSEPKPPIFAPNPYLMKSRSDKDINEPATDNDIR